MPRLLKHARARCALVALSATLVPLNAAFAQANPNGLSRDQIERECRQILYYDECVAAGGYRAWSEGQSNQRSGSSGWTPERQLYTNQPGTAVNPGSSGWSADRQLYRNQPGTAQNNGSPGWAADRQTYKNQPGTSDNPGSPGWSADRQVYTNQPGTSENRGSPGWSADRQTYANQPGTAQNKGSPGWSADRQVYSNQPGTSQNRGSSGWSADRQTYANQPGTSANPGSPGWSADRQQYQQPSATAQRSASSANVRANVPPPPELILSIPLSDMRIANSTPPVIHERRTVAGKIVEDAAMSPIEEEAYRRALKRFPKFTGVFRFAWHVNLLVDAAQLFLMNPKTAH